MTRVVDSGLEARRRRAIDSISMARNNAVTMADKCAELEALTRAQVGGHHLGDVIASQLTLSQEALRRAAAGLLQAAGVAQRIDVTVDVPDTEES